MQTQVRPDTLLTENLELQSLRIVAIGDSLVYGYGDPEGGGWVERLRRQWMEPEAAGHALYNLGVRGDGVTQVLRRLDVEFRHRGEMRNRLPDRIILSVGVNDSARLAKPQGRNLTDFETFQLAIAQLLDHAQQLCPVWVVGMVPVDESKMPFLECLYYNHADQKRYQDATRLACQARQIPYLDLFERWQMRGEQWWRSRLSADGLHPNSEGYRAILQEVLAWAPIASVTDRG
jgi:lysophospholipase L1-like esterase